MVQRTSYCSQQSISRSVEFKNNLVYLYKNRHYKNPIVSSCHQTKAAVLNQFKILATELAPKKPAGSQERRSVYEKNTYLKIFAFKNSNFFNFIQKIYLQFQRNFQKKLHKNHKSFGLYTFQFFSKSISIQYIVSDSCSRNSKKYQHINLIFSFLL